jgi:hypothetical protein
MGDFLSQSKVQGDGAIRPIVIGNWKMHGLKAALSEAVMVKDQLQTLNGRADAMICPPSTLIMARRSRSAVRIAALKRMAHSRVMYRRTCFVMAAQLPSFSGTRNAGLVMESGIVTCAQRCKRPIALA